MQTVLEYAATALRLSTVVPQVGLPSITNALLFQGHALARLYARATLEVRSPQRQKVADGLVEAGDPLMLIEVNDNEVSIEQHPSGFISVNPGAVFGARLYFGRIKVNTSIIATWLLFANSASRSQIRSLRLCLMRLHAEQVALDLVLKQIQRGRLLNPTTEAEVGKLDHYFNRSTRLINREMWGQVSQSAILEAFDAAQMVIPPANRKNLVDRYDGARRQVWEKVDLYQIRRATARVVSVNVINLEPGDKTNL